MLRAMWLTVFHQLWGLNKEGVYNKQKWMELQRHLEELETDLKVLSVETLKAKYLVRQ